MVGMPQTDNPSQGQLRLPAQHSTAPVCLRTTMKYSGLLDLHSNTYQKELQ